MKQYTSYLFDMGSTLLEFHNPKWNESEILKTGHKRMTSHISGIYGQSIADKIDKEVILPWYDYVEKERKIKRLEYRICEALFLKFGELGIHISYNEIIEILKNLAKKRNKCVIVVTHSKEVANEADMILGLKNKKLNEVKEAVK